MCRYACNYGLTQFTLSCGPHAVLLHGPTQLACSHPVHTCSCCIAAWPNPICIVVTPSIHAQAASLHGPAQFTCSHPCGPHMLKPNSLHFPSTHAETIIAWSNPFHMQSVLLPTHAKGVSLSAQPMPNAHSSHYTIQCTTVNAHSPTHFTCSHPFHTCSDSITAWPNPFHVKPSYLHICML